ncbi:MULTISPECIES: porin [Paraburkholderia]|jgi:predicted porin|uniref:Porin n=1 Tax=Paraburkholderia largidicola TaxID=3014751 RepID=A0A7I8BRP2_9BURK|nr:MULTISPECIES: porin [Paraburkholderia]BCF91427.1 porin [Paraburkholderia sp. PGU16]GJH37728.1 porin [Paraburkholderia hospita]CAG9258033.1 Outer membrane porin protein 32 precursor [Paraburkholderia caribensis]
MTRQIKRTVTALGATAIALACQSAFAQSSVTLYGVADVGIRYLTHSNANNDGRLFMTNGAITNSRFGIKGSEDLGNGLKAIFQLESGIDLQSGAQSDSKRLFNRAAYVGLSSNYGTLTLGRQKTPLFDLLGDTYDPLTVGNYFENAWLPVALGAGLYADNAVKYDGKFGGLNVKAMYSFGTNSTSTGADGFSGQVPGHLGAGNMYGFTASYAFGSLSVGAGVQQNSDNSNHKQTIYNANAVYAFSTTKIYVGYIHSKDDTGFVDSTLSQRDLTLGVDILKGSGRKDDGPFAGVTWQATPALLLTGAFYYDHMKNAAIGGGAVGSGNRYTGVAVAEYSLSKRTEVYGTVDFNKVTGAATVELPGTSNQTGVSLGLRTIF